MRINKYLALSGVASRRHADNLITQGRVEINGKTIKELGVAVDEQTDIVKVDGKIVSPETGTYYLLMNKPTGCLVSAKDPHHVNLVTDYLKQYKGKVFPVGRLDYDSSGLLIFTNDGNLAFRLSHPRYGIKKTYEVVCDGTVTELALKKLQDGVMLKDGITAPAKAKAIQQNDTSSVIHITIHEGRKRQVRRMIENVGFTVSGLKRIAYGNLKLDNLPEGRFIEIDKKQLQKLKNSVGLK